MLVLLVRSAVSVKVESYLALASAAVSLSCYLFLETSLHINRLMNRIASLTSLLMCKQFSRKIEILGFRRSY